MALRSNSKAQSGLSPLPSRVTKRLERVLKNSEALCRRLNDDKATPTGTEGKDFHSELRAGAELVSNGCTKMAVLFSKPPAPSPEEIEAVSHQLEQATLQLLLAYHCIHSNQGTSLQFEARNSILDIFTNTKKLVESFIQEGFTGSVSRLRGSGTVWASCEQMSKLSKDNRAAVYRVCLTQLRLLRDAWDEAKALQSRKGESEDWIEGFDGDCSEEEEEEEGSALSVDGVADRLAGATLLGGEETLQWTKEDMRVVNPCISIIQGAVEFTEFACKELVTRCHGDGVGVAALDGVAAEVKRLSPMVDHLVSELPAPITPQQLSKMAVDLWGALGKFIISVEACQHQNSDRTERFKEQFVSHVTRLTDTVL